MNLEEMKSILPPHTPGDFATVDGNQADIRGWQFQIIEDNRIYFCTSNQKNVFRQLQNNSHCAFICNADGYSFRISGEAVIVTEKGLTAQIHATLDEQVASVYPTPESNGFTVFYLEHGEVKYAKNSMFYESFTF